MLADASARRLPGLGRVAVPPPSTTLVGWAMVDEPGRVRRGDGGARGKIMGDVPNYTNVQPELLVGEVTGASNRRSGNRSSGEPEEALVDHGAVADRRHEHGFAVARSHMSTVSASPGRTGDVNRPSTWWNLPGSLPHSECSNARPVNP